MPGLLLNLGVGLVAPVVAVYAVSFGVDYAVAGLVITAVAVGRAVTNIPCGLLIDRVGRRIPVVTSPLVIAAASVLAGLAATFPELVLWRFVEGVGLSLWEVSRRTILVDEVPPHLRGRLVSTYYAFTGFGMAIGPVVGGLVATAYGIRWAFFSYSFISLVCFLAVLLLIKESKPAASGKPQGLRQSLGFISELGRYKLTFYLIAAGFMIMTLRGASNQTLFPLFGSIDLGLSIDQIGYALGLMAVMGLLVRFPGGYISDRYGRKRAFVPCQALGGIAAIGMTFSNDYTSILLWMTIAGIGGGMSGGTATALIADISPGSSRGIFIGVWQTLTDCSSIVGPVLLGLVADYYGLRLSFLVPGVALLVSAVTVQLFALETRNAQNDAAGGKSG